MGQLTSGAGINALSNVGSGEGQVAKDITGQTARFKNIKAGENTTVVDDGSDITISSSGILAGAAGANSWLQAAELSGYVTSGSGDGSSTWQAARLNNRYAAGDKAIVLPAGKQTTIEKTLLVWGDSALIGRNSIIAPATTGSDWTTEVGSATGAEYPLVSAGGNFAYPTVGQNASDAKWCHFEGLHINGAQGTGASTFGTGPTSKCIGIAYNGLDGRAGKWADFMASGTQVWEILAKGTARYITTEQCWIGHSMWNINYGDYCDLFAVNCDIGIRSMWNDGGGVDMYSARHWEVWHARRAGVALINVARCRPLNNIRIDGLVIKDPRNGSNGQGNAAGLVLTFEDGVKGASGTTELPLEGSRTGTGRGDGVAGTIHITNFSEEYHYWYEGNLDVIPFQRMNGSELGSGGAWSQAKFRRTPVSINGGYLVTFEDSEWATAAAFARMPISVRNGGVVELRAGCGTGSVQVPWQCWAEDAYSGIQYTDDNAGNGTAQNVFRFPKRLTLGGNFQEHWIGVGNGLVTRRYDGADYASSLGSGWFASDTYDHDGLTGIGRRETPELTAYGTGVTITRNSTHPVADPLTGASRLATKIEYPSSTTKTHVVETKWLKGYSSASHGDWAMHVVMLEFYLDAATPEARKFKIFRSNGSGAMQYPEFYNLKGGMTDEASEELKWHTNTGSEPNNQGYVRMVPYEYMTLFPGVVHTVVAVLGGDGADFCWGWRIFDPPYGNCTYASYSGRPAYGLSAQELTSYTRPTGAFTMYVNNLGYMRCPGGVGLTEIGEAVHKLRYK